MIMAILLVILMGLSLLYPHSLLQNGGNSIVVAPEKVDYYSGGSSNGKPLILITLDGKVFSNLYCEIGSKLQIVCEVFDVQVKNLHWYHNYHKLFPGDIRRRTEVETSEDGYYTKSTLTIFSVKSTDSGNYLCLFSPTEAVSVMLHVLNDGRKGESGSGGLSRSQTMSLVTTKVFYVVFVQFIFTVFAIMNIVRNQRGRLM